MDLNNITKGKLTTSEVDLFILGLLKGEESFLTLSRKGQEEVLTNKVSLILNIFKEFNLEFDVDSIVAKLDEYISILGTLPSISIITESDLMQYKKTLSQIKKKSENISHKKEVLDSGVNRIQLNKEKFIAYLTRIFSDIPLEINQKNFCTKQTRENILEVPLSDINLEGFYYQDNLNRGFLMIQNIIEQVIQRQVDTDYKYKKVNIFFLGNIINRILTKEQDFQVSQINYNIMFECSIYLIKTYFLLKEFFPEVEYTFSLEQLNYRQLELKKEHFSNYNINYERIIPKLLISKLELYNLENTIHDFDENSFFNITEYSENKERITISYGSYKTNGREVTKMLDLDNIEKELIKKRRLHFRNLRIYIGSKDLYLNTDGHRDIRVCPSIFYLMETGQLLPIFEVSKDGVELSKIWIKVLEENKIDITPIDVKEDIQFYDFIKKTFLSTKRDNRQLAIIQ